MVCTPPSPVYMVCATIENGTIEDTDLKEKTYVGKYINAEIYKDILQEKSTYTDQEYLKTFKPEVWVKKQNKKTVPARLVSSLQPVRLEWP